MNDVREELARNPPVSLCHCARELNHVRRIDERLVRATVPLLETLGVGLGDAETVHDVVRDVVAAEGNRAEMANLALVKDGEIGGAGAHLDERDTELLLVLGEDGERARQRLEHELPHPIARALHRLAQIQRR